MPSSGWCRNRVEEPFPLLPTPVSEDTGRSPEAHLEMKRSMPGSPRTQITSLAVLAQRGFSQPEASSQESEDSISLFTDPLEQSQLGSASPTSTVDESLPVIGPESRSCPTCGNSMEAHPESSCCTEATPASPSPRPGASEARATPDISGPSSPAAFAFFDPGSSSWRMSQATLFSDSSESLLILPRRGSMRSGWLYERQILVHLIDASGYSGLPTPAARDAKGKAPRLELTEDLQGVMSVLFPTPGANDYTGGRHETSRGGGSGLKGIDDLLPDPDLQLPGGSQREVALGGRGQGIAVDPQAVADTDRAGLGQRSQLDRDPQPADPKHEGGDLEGRGPGEPQRSSVSWGVYGPAVRRWERILGVPAPRPTNDRGRLMPEFVEWMVGLPVGWTEGLAKTHRLRMLGNAVVPRQCELALKILTRQ